MAEEQVEGWPAPTPTWPPGTGPSPGERVTPNNSWQPQGWWYASWRRPGNRGLRLKFYFKIKFAAPLYLGQCQVTQGKDDMSVSRTNMYPPSTIRPRHRPLAESNDTLEIISYFLLNAILRLYSAASSSDTPLWISSVFFSSSSSESGWGKQDMIIGRGAWLGNFGSRLKL